MYVYFYLVSFVRVHQHVMYVHVCLYDMRYVFKIIMCTLRKIRPCTYGLINTKCTCLHYSKLSPLLYKIYKTRELHKFFIESCIDGEIVLYVLLFLYNFFEIQPILLCAYVCLVRFFTPG